jgi:hypothetical protein
MRAPREKDIFADDYFSETTANLCGGIKGELFLDRESFLAIGFVVVLAIVKFAFQAVAKLGSETSLDFSSAESAGQTGAMFTVIRIRWTNAQFLFFSSALFPATFFELPAVHVCPPC